MDLLTTTQAAKVLKVHASRIRQLAGAGLLVGQHLGRDWVFTAEAVERCGRERAQLHSGERVAS